MKPRTGIRPEPMLDQAQQSERKILQLERSPGLSMGLGDAVLGPWRMLRHLIGALLVLQACRDPGVPPPRRDRTDARPTSFRISADGMANPPGDASVPMPHAPDVLVVTQALFDPVRGTLLTEEGISDLCTGVGLTLWQWNGCISVNHTVYTSGWFEALSLRLRERGATDGRLLRELGAREGPGRLLLDYRGGGFLVLDPKERAIRYSRIDGGQPDLVYQVPATDRVLSARLLPGGRLLIAGRRDRPSKAGFLRIVSIASGSRTVLERQFDYRADRFVAPDWERADNYGKGGGMASEVLYDLCQGEDGEVCGRPQLKELAYSKVLKRDAFVRMDATPDGKVMAVVVFGDLKVFRLEGEELTLIREWKDAFYESKDWYMEDPSVTISEDGETVALVSTRRLIRVGMVSSGQLATFRDRAAPVGYPEVLGCALRGVTFDRTARGVLLVAQRPGNVARIDYQKRSTTVIDVSDRRFPNREGRTGWESIGYIGNDAKRLIVWAEGTLGSIERHANGFRWIIGSDYFGSMGRTNLYRLHRNSDFCERDRHP